MLLPNNSFDSKRDAVGNDASSGYSSLSPPTVSLTLYGSGFSGRCSHTKLTYVTVRLFGTYSFLINYIVLVALTRLWIPLARLPISFPTAFHQVSLSPPINKVSIVYFLPFLLKMWKSCSNLNIWLEKHAVLLGCGIFFWSCVGNGVGGVELAGVPLVFS